MEHWKADWLFGYQCLNGSNPRMIQRCKKLPENFPVTPDMVQTSMTPKTNLDKELKVRKCTIQYLVYNICNYFIVTKYIYCKIVYFIIEIVD